MVRPRLLGWLYVLLLLSGFAQSALAQVLRVHVANTRVELGKPVWITLSSDQTAVSLDSIDFGAWHGLVVLSRNHYANIAPDNRSQSLRLRVYPLHTGLLTLPGLQFLHQTSPGLKLDILPARDASTQRPMTFSYHVSTLSPWQQQQVIVSCVLTLPDPYAVLTQAKRQIEGTGIIPMKLQRQTFNKNGKPLMRYKLGWVLLPSRAGALPVQLPPVDYVRDGVVARRFYVPPFKLKIQALPNWLPGTIPVGRVKVLHYGVTPLWLTAGALAYANLHIQIKGVARDLIPAYSQGWRSRDTLKFYPGQHALQSSVDQGGLHHYLRDSIPFVAASTGLYRLPKLRLQFFTPHSGKLHTVLIPGPSILVLGRWLQLLLLGLLAWGFFRLGRQLWFLLMHFWQRYRSYRRVLRQMPQVSSLGAVRASMQAMAQAEGWESNMTYRQWQLRMQAVAPLAAKLDITQLNAACYGRGETNISAVVAILARICQRRCFGLS